MGAGFRTEDVADAARKPAPARAVPARATGAALDHRAGPVSTQQCLALQRGAGNRAVGRLVGAVPPRPGARRADRPASEAHAGAGAEPRAGEVVQREPEEDGAPAGPPQVEGEQGAGGDEGPPPGVEVTGTLPAGEVDNDETLAKGRGVAKEDGPVRPRPASGPAAPDRARRRPVTLRVGNVHLEVEGQQRADLGPSTSDASLGSHGDQVKSAAPTVNWTNPGGRPTDPFGEEAFEPSYSNVTWRAKDNEIKVDFTLNVKCPWGVNSGGMIDVPSATDAVVTPSSYRQIVHDLTPRLIEKSWRAPRTQYWSKAICERHEKYHSTDDKQWAEGPGKRVVTDYLNSKTIDIGWLGRYTGISPDTTAALTRMLDEAMVEMSNANFAFYTGGETSYLSYAGEERAFGDGKVPYQELAAGVKAHGEALKGLQEGIDAAFEALSDMFG